MICACGVCYQKGRMLRDLESTLIDGCEEEED